MVQTDVEVLEAEVLMMLMKLKMLMLEWEGTEGTLMTAD